MSIEQQQRIVQMRGTKADCIALTAALEEGAIAYATDTGELGLYTNGAFVWLGTIALDSDAATVLDITGNTIGLDVQNANTVWAGPTSGAANEPTFRALVDADLPFTVVTGHEHVYQEDLSARCNGSATLFYTANAYEGDTTQVWINGVLQRPVTQYTEDTSSYDTLTLSSAPVAGDEFIVAYTMATA